MFTLGYSFRPWIAAKSIADGRSILDYIVETAREHGIDRKVRFNHRVTRASWSSNARRWTIEVESGVTRQPANLTCDFILACSGYYSYAEGFKPSFAGMARFKGKLVHPQEWTPDIDYANKRVAGICSGATPGRRVPPHAEE